MSVEEKSWSWKVSILMPVRFINECKILKQKYSAKLENEVTLKPYSEHGGIREGSKNVNYGHVFAVQSSQTK